MSAISASDGDGTSEEDTRRAWRAILHDPLLSFSSLKTRGIHGEIGTDTDGVTLRSLYWRLYLSYLPSLDTSSWPLVLNRERSLYEELKLKYLLAPDGSYPEDDPSSPALKHKFGAETHGSLSSITADLAINNPLSLDQSNPWQDWFRDQELRKVIRQDVERTFPDMPFFRDVRAQADLTTVLFIYCKLNPDVGYRQGMHELLAFIYLVVKADALVAGRSSSPPSGPALKSPGTSSRLGGAGASEGRRDEKAKAIEGSTVRLTLSADYAEHDAFVLFSALMKAAKPWYEWRESKEVKPSSGKSGEQQKTPVLLKCERLHKLLRVYDPALHAHLESVGIEPQIYALRWIRLMCTREFPVQDSLLLWDGLFAEDPSLRLIDHICIAMLLRLRNELLDADYSGILQLLLRYPARPAGQNQMSLLVRQAIYLRDHQTPAAGATVIFQNYEELGIPVAPPGSYNDRQQTPRSAQTNQTIAGRPSGSRPSLQRPLGPGGSFMGGLAATPAAYLPEGLSELAKGVYEKSEALGINRAILSTMANLQRNVGALNTAVGPDLDSGRSSASPVFAAEPTAWARDSWRQVEPQRELDRLKTTNKAMGMVLDACIDALEKQWLAHDEHSKGGKVSATEDTRTVPKDETRGPAGTATPKGDQALDEPSEPATNEDRTSASAAASAGPQPAGVEDLSQGDLSTLMSLTALKHVRDVLKGTAAEFNANILASPGGTEPQPRTASIASPSPTARRFADSAALARPPLSNPVDPSPSHPSDQAGAAKKPAPPLEPRSTVPRREQDQKPIAGGIPRVPFQRPPAAKAQSTAAPSGQPKRPVDTAAHVASSPSTRPSQHPPHPRPSHSASFASHAGTYSRARSATSDSSSPLSTRPVIAEFGRFSSSPFPSSQASTPAVYTYPPVAETGPGSSSGSGHLPGSLGPLDSEPAFPARVPSLSTPRTDPRKPSSSGGVDPLGAIS